jgi:glycosyltransferase involved in cell wall biosynthesis
VQISLGLGIRTRWRRRRMGPHIDDDYREAQMISALLHAPQGADLAPPADLHGPLNVAIVVPFFSRGSGGHMSIANIVRALEARGHRLSLWIDDPGRRCFGGPERACRDLRAWFGPFEAPVHYGCDAFTGADVVVATGWQTAARVRTMPAAGRAYLVQDHEPEFFGTSVHHAWAEQSYGFGLHPITAGEWLATVMRDRYGLPATWFALGIDGEHYRPMTEVPRRDDVVLAYARKATPRRGVPVVLAALAEVVRRRPQTEVWLFGHGGSMDVDFPHRNLGVVAAEDLPALYNEATVGLVLSMTNYSLVAQEMLACGLASVELDAPSVTMALGATDSLSFAPLDPVALADAVIELLDDPQLRHERARQGAQLRETRTWTAAAEQVEAGLRAAITGDVAPSGA